MPSFEGTPIYCPTRWTVGNLLQRNACGHHDFFRLGGVLKDSIQIGVKRLDEVAATPGRRSGSHESAPIVKAQPSSLDSDSPRYRVAGRAVRN